MNNNNNTTTFNFKVVVLFNELIQIIKYGGSKMINSFTNILITAALLTPITFNN